MMSGDDVVMMPASRRVEVITGSGRRRWSPDQKARIVQESYATSTGDVAMRYDLSKTQIFTWRRDARRGRPRIEFAKVEVDTADRSDAGFGHGVIEVTVGGDAVRLGPGADAGLATAVIMALKARGR